jgi:phosphoglycerol transferase MdoB-like AlkP superfamily enzyme
MHRITITQSVLSDMTFSQLCGFLLLTGFLSILATQWISSGSSGKSLIWMLTQPAAFIFSLLAVQSLALLAVALTNRTWLAFSLTFFLCYLIAKVDQVKYETALTHFLWSDLFKASDPGKFGELVGHYVKPAFFLPLLLGLAAGNICVLALFGRPFAAGRAGLTGRLPAVLISLLLLFCFWHYGTFAASYVGRQICRLPELNVKDYDANTRRHGCILAFLAHVTLEAREQDPPADYGAAQAPSVLEVLTSAAPHQSAPADPALIPQPPVKPLIVVLVIESLWDITRIPGLTFSEDPLAAFRADYAGDLRASCFAGLTANTEFEFLTSFSMQAMHDSACPFIRMDRSIPALPSQLHQYGYRTTAIHSFTRTFYDRDRVYSQLGFDQFWGLEDLEKAGHVRKKGWYMADEALLLPIQQLIRETDAPQLIYTLTMQNHGPYASERYAASELDPAAIPEIAPGLIRTPGDRQAVIQYTQGVRDSGRLYQAVRDTLVALDRSAVLLAFGDHLPGIGENSGFQIMLDSGLAKDVRDPVLYSVPVFYMANPAAQAAGLQPDLHLSQTTADRRPGFNTLAGQLVQAAGLPLSPVQQLVQRLETAETDKGTDGFPSRGELQRVYEWIQYDWRWGDGFTRQR